MISLNVCTVSATDVNGSLNMIGTNTALGSPLLNSSFNAEEFQTEEVIIFGIFLSNFPVPLLDDYASCFSSGSGGSDGYGYRALQFGSGSIETTLKNLLDHAITIQTSQLKPIYVKSATEVDGIGDGEVLKYIDGSQGEPVKATVYDFFKTYDEGVIASGADGDTGLRFSIEENSASGDVGKYKQFSKVHAPEFYITPDNADVSQYTVFNYGDAYDVSMMMAWISRLMTGIDDEYRKTVLDTKYDALMNDEEAYLFLDVFGNIVAADKDSGKYVMVFPACSNQYLTERNSYNFLTSTFLGGSYIDASNKTLKLKVEADEDGVLDDRYKGGTSAVDDDTMWDWLLSNKNTGLESGSTIMYFDSDSYSKSVGYNNVHIGNMWLDIMNSKPTKENSSKSGLKVEIIKASGTDGLPTSFKNMSTYYDRMGVGIQDLSNSLLNIDILGKLGEEGLPLFDGGMLVACNYNAVSGNVNKADPDDKAYKVRMFTSYLGDIATGNQNIVTVNGITVPTSKEIQNKLSTLSSLDSVRDYFYNGSGGMSPMLYNYLVNNGFPDVSISDSANKYIDDADAPFRRVIKITPRSAQIDAVHDILNVDPTAQFAQWTPSMYMTYLQWYGLIGSKYNKLNKTVFTIENFKIDNSKIETETVTPEDAANLAMQYLDAEKGRTLRLEVITNLIEDFIYRVYVQIVYGGTESTGGITTNSSNGFLTVNTFTSNPFTSWFIDNFVKFVVPLVGITIIILIVVSIIGRKSLTWFMVTTLTIVNIVLITPSLGDIVPYLTSRIEAQIFSDRLDFWAISELVQNKRLESEARIEDNYGEDISSDVVNLVKLFNTNYADRSLMLRWDISKKVTESELGNLSELQQYQSTRWMLPAILKEYTAKDNSEDYVYISLIEALDNAQYMYWLYNPADMVASGYTNADIGTASEVLNSEKESRYKGYTVLENSRDSDWYLYKSTSRMSENPIHSQFYLMEGLVVPDIDLDRSLKEIEQDVKSVNSNISSGFEATEALMEQIGGKYNSWSLDTVDPEYGYMWVTESPLTYFYMAIKDSFNAGDSLGKVVTDLQGVYTDNDAGENVRTSFMHYDMTGKIKDVVDIEELLTNVVPYVYTSQIVAGGVSGEDGVFGDELITNYKVYKNNRKSWLFRSNWATKLLEGNLNSPDTVKDVNGNKYKVERPMLPSSYPEGRPMVFSEAQRDAMGLSDFDLSKVELKILEVNKNIVEKWTLLINYANLEGMSADILQKQMALIATTEFNKGMSPGGFFNERLSLYPTTIELRNISFNSVMTMLMLNATKNTNYVYGNVMLNLIAQSDLLSSILLLCVTWMAVWLMPLILNIVMAMLFYLGIYSTTVNLGSSSRTKIVNLGAYFLDLILVVVMVSAYYGSISMMMGMSSPNDVLNVGGGVVDIDSPTMILILLAIISVVFIRCSIKMIKFLFKNRRDMGATKFTMMAGDFMSAMSNGIGNISSTLSRLGADGESRASGVSSRTVIINNGKNGEKTVEEIEDDEHLSSDMDRIKDDEDTEEGREVDRSIDREIDKGKENIREEQGSGE